MEIEFSYFIILLSLLIFVLMLLNRPKIDQKSILTFPPGPRKFPFIGNLLTFATTYPPHRNLTDLAIKYGTLMHLKLGEVNVIIVSSPEIAKQVLRTHDVTFASRPVLVVSEIICYGNTDIAFAPYGEYWRQLRKICTLELLSAKRVQSFRSIREEEFSDLCKYIASNAGSPINLTERVNSSNYNIVTRASLGTKAGENENFITVIKEVVQLAGGFDICDMYPSIKFFRVISGLQQKLRSVHRELDRILGSIIDQHKLADTKKSEKHEDFIDVLLKFQEDGLGVRLSIDNIKSVLMNMFAGGTETSTTTIDWAMAEMLKNPRVLQKTQEEVRLVFDKKGYIDESDIDELKYLKAVINETLRMHPPLPLLLPRENSVPCEINGYKIPAKTRVMINAWAIGRDPRYWEDATSFKPERFLKNSSPIDYKGNNFEYIPFGGGRRICPGISFGLANVELPLAMLLYHFDWILPNGMKPHELKMSEVFGVTVRRKHDLSVIPVVKKQLHEH